MPSPQTGSVGPVLLLPGSELSLVVPELDDDVPLLLPSADVSVLVLVPVEVSEIPPLSLAPVLVGHSVTPRSAMSASISSMTHPVGTRAEQISRFNDLAEQRCRRFVTWIKVPLNYRSKQ